MAGEKYCDYFDVDEGYFPCIDESAINAGAPWENTYPHETFIGLLNAVEKMMGGSTKRSIWIHGAYGTGKSQCAYALKKILESPEEEVRAYWNTYEPLQKNQALLDKILGHKERGIVTAYRYASGSITTPQQLFLAVQESIAAAIKRDPKVTYLGENSLKESAIAWMSQPAQGLFVDSLLQKPEWSSLFSESSANEIIQKLKKQDNVASLMSNLLSMAAKEGITALQLTADSLRTWIIDVLQKNQTKLVFIWDEFSDFFRQNRNSLGELQKLVSICQEAPFYFLIVTHPLSSLTSNDDSWKIIQQRFDKVEISLPSNIAFELIGHAFTVSSAAESKWSSLLTEDLNARVSSARLAVMKAANIKSDRVMEKMIPIHPMAAIVLKNIASAFQSNQRSMFDFIKTPKDMDIQAFQWFIKNYGPYSDRPFLTIDLLWNFFYEKGKDYLSTDIRQILDVFPQQSTLIDKEKIVLKTILIMQAIDQRLGGNVPLFKATDQNLDYAFNGDDVLSNECRSIAKALINKGILIQTLIGDGKKVYQAAILAGGDTKIDGYRSDIQKTSTTSKLIQEGPALKTALNLSPALKLRYAMSDMGDLLVVTMTDFKKQMDVLKTRDKDWHFYAVLALAKLEDEAQAFRQTIKKTIADEQYHNIVVIDALSTPLGYEAFDQYVNFAAMAQYYQGNNNQQSKENAKKARDVLERTWCNRIHDGQFIVYTTDCPDGEKANGADAVQVILQTIVRKRFPYVFDFTKGLSESQLKLTTAKQVASYGMGGKELKGVIAGCDRTVLGKVWNREKYWTMPDLANEPIVFIKKAVDAKIEAEFKRSGKIALSYIYDCLETDYGFAPCNLSAFLTGFLLKEYSVEPYRSMNAEGHRDAMTPDKLAEMIGEMMIGKNPKPTYIVSLTDEERAFNDLTEAAWKLQPDACASLSLACSAVLGKMRDLTYPVWCLKEVDDHCDFEIVQKYMTLVQSKGDDAHDIANQIGKIALQRPSLAAHLRSLLTKDNCQKGMLLFLDHFEGGKLKRLAQEIGAEDHLLNDIEKLFRVEYSNLWVEATGENEIRKLIVDYEVIKASNSLLNASDRTKETCFKSWRENLKFLGSSCASISDKKPALNTLFSYLLRIFNRADMLPENMKAFLEELTQHAGELRDMFRDKLGLFVELYRPYLDGVSLEECERIQNLLSNEMFALSVAKSNEAVQKAANDLRKSQVKAQMYNLWMEKTGGSKSPRDWSAVHQTPILCCVPPELYSEAKKVFAALNRSSQTEAEINDALAFLRSASFFDELADPQYCDAHFMQAMLGNYVEILSDLQAVRAALERLPVEPYEWMDNPTVKKEVARLANHRYQTEGSREVFKVIEEMGDAKLIQWLKDLAVRDIDLGIKILKSGR